MHKDMTNHYGVGGPMNGTIGYTLGAPKDATREQSVSEMIVEVESTAACLLADLVSLHSNIQHHPEPSVKGEAAQSTNMKQSLRGTKEMLINAAQVVREIRMQILG